MGYPEFVNEQTFHELCMDYRAASSEHAHARFLDLIKHIVKETARRDEERSTQ